MRASGGFSFPDGTTLTSRAGKLTLTSAEGEVLPGPSAAGTGTVNRLAKWAETGGAGTLADAAGAEVSGLTFFGQNQSGQVAPLFAGAASFHVVEVGATGTKSPLTLAGGSGVMEFWRDLGGGAGNPAAAAAFGVAKPGTTATDDMVFSTYKPGAGWNERMRIASGGNVGIGTSTPTVRLDVAGAVNTSTQYNIRGYRVLLADDPSTNPGNTFVGAEAGKNNPTLPSVSNGHFNTFVGTSAGRDNTEGSHNAFFGWSAGVRNTTGSANIFIGREAGEFNSSGSGNIFIGLSSGFTNSTGNSITLIGDSTVTPFDAEDVENATAVGARAQVTQSNSMVLGSIAGVNSATADTRVGIGTTAPKTKFHLANGKIYIEANGQGVILKSPNGTCYEVTVTDAGALASTTTTCP